MIDRLAILDICEGEMNVAEVRGDVHNPRIVEYHEATCLKASDDETPWCASFVNWVLQQSGGTGTDSAAARSFLKWGEPLKEPKIGCVVVFKRGTKPWQGHVGFYMGRNRKGDIVTLGGNQSNQVCLATYPARDLLGFRT